VLNCVITYKEIYRLIHTIVNFLGTMIRSINIHMTIFMIVREN